jgi:uncharacterized protein YkwD
MRYPSALLLCVLLFAAAVSASAQNRSYLVSFDAAPTGINRDISALQVYDLVNRERSRQGLTFLSWDDQLAELARQYSEQMARGAFFDHVDPNGLRVQDRAFAAGMQKWTKIGENLFHAKDVNNFSRLAVRMWMDSDSHRANILDRSYSAAGVGIATAPDGRVYVTQLYLQR